MNTQEKEIKIWHDLVDIMLEDIIKESRDNARERITYCMCTRCLRGVVPEDFDPAKTRVVSNDKERFYVGMSFKNGVGITVPIKKSSVIKYGLENLFNLHL